MEEFSSHDLFIEKCSRSFNQYPKHINKFYSILISFKLKKISWKKIPSIAKYAQESFDFTQIPLTYANYSIDQVIKAILPDDLGKDKPINTGSRI